MLCSLLGINVVDVLLDVFLKRFEVGAVLLPLLKRPVVGSIAIWIFILHIVVSSVKRDFVYCFFQFIDCLKYVDVLLQQSLLGCAIHVDGREGIRNIVGTLENGVVLSEVVPHTVGGQCVPAVVTHDPRHDGFGVKFCFVVAHGYSRLSL